MHIFYERQFFCYNLFINVFNILLLLAHTATSLNCYVCSSEDKLNDCSSFNISNKDLFTVQCSPVSQGCSTQIEDNQIIHMACEDFHLDDCQFANGIEYCYCNTNLCNGNISNKKAVSHNTGLNDDEDLAEGSGFKIFTETNLKTFTTSTLQPTVSLPNTGGCLHSTFFIIAAAVFLLP